MCVLHDHPKREREKFKKEGNESRKREEREGTFLLSILQMVSINDNVLPSKPGSP